MKVLQISQYYFPHVGGVEKHLVKINQQLIKAGHQIKVIAGNQEKNLAKKEVIDQVSIYRINNRPSSNYKLKIWQQIINHYKLMAEADVIHIHDVFWWIIPIYPLIFHKLFITFHGHEKSILPSKKAIFWHQIAHHLTRGSIAVGGFHEKYYGIKANKVIFGAGEEKIYKSGKQNKNKIIFAGRLVEETGILTYLKALKILKDKNKEYKLDVFGNGPQMSSAQQYAKQNQLAVIFHGTVADVEPLFTDYSIAFVSRYLSIAEALKQGCRVIAHYQNSFIKDYLDLSIFKELIFSSDDPKEIAEALKHPPQVKKLSMSLNKTLSWDQIAKDYLQLWQKK